MFLMSNIIKQFSLRWIAFTAFCFASPLAAVDFKPYDWGGVAARYQNDENSFALYMPHVWEKGPRFGLFGGESRSSSDKNYGLAVNQYLSSNKDDKFTFFADLKFGRAQYKTKDQDKESYRFFELGLFSGVNIGWPNARKTIVVSVGLVDRSNFVSDSTISENNLQIAQRKMEPAWQIWFFH